MPTPRRDGRGGDDHRRTAGIARNSLWLTVDTLASMAATLLASVLVARALGPDTMGQFNFALYFATVLKIFADFALSVTVRKFSAELIGRGDHAGVRTLVAQAMRLQVALGGVALVVGAAGVVLAFPKGQELVGVLAVVSIVPSLLISMPTGALWAAGRLEQNVIASLVGTALNVAGTVLAVVAGWGLVGLMAALLLSRTADFALRFHLFRRVYDRMPAPARPAPPDPGRRRRMLRFAGQQMVLVLLYVFLFDRVEIFFLKALSTPREIAFFSLSFTLVSYLLQVPLNLAQSASVRVWVEHESAPDAAARTTAVATWFVLLLAAPALFGLAAVGEPLLRLVYGQRYLEAGPTLAVLALGSLGIVASQPVRLLLVGGGRSGVYIAGMSLAAAVSVLGNLLLVPAHGALGSAVAKGVAQGAVAFGFIAYAWRRMGARPPLARVGKLLLACAGMAAGVRMLGRGLSPMPTLLVGVPAGVILFVLLARWLRLIDAVDAARLEQVAGMVPARARSPVRALVAFVAPSSGGASPG